MRRARNRRADPPTWHSRETFYRWKRIYGGMEIADAKRLQALEKENGRLKRVVADQALNIQVLKDVLGKKW